MTREICVKRSLFSFPKKEKEFYISFARCKQEEGAIDSSDDTKRPAHASSCLLLLILRVLLSLG